MTFLFRRFRRLKAKQNGLLWRKCLGLSAGVNMVLVSVLCFMVISWGKDTASFCCSEYCPRYRVAEISNWTGIKHLH